VRVHKPPLHAGGLIDDLGGRALGSDLAARLLDPTAALARPDGAFAARLTGVTAPTGFGKTTLVRAWVIDVSARAARSRRAISRSSR
jgi:hypothetical protein